MLKKFGFRLLIKATNLTIQNWKRMLNIANYIVKYKVKSYTIWPDLIECIHTCLEQHPHRPKMKSIRINYQNIHTFILFLFYSIYLFLFHFILVHLNINLLYSVSAGNSWLYLQTCSEPNTCTLERAIHELELSELIGKNVLTN